MGGGQANKRIEELCRAGGLPEIDEIFRTLWLLARPCLHHRFDSEVIEWLVQPRAGLIVDVLHDYAHELLPRHIWGRAFAGKSFKECSHLAKAHPLHKQRGIIAGEKIPTSGHPAV